ncbi:SMI1/KNR4 family protein [Streptomyces sp. NPDC001401]|uniref:SMI1/KNR4 family protein n=1 Tax=Streptomyces sp. NPDC001401 TaxID=3364570 RepID=UPI0036C1114B
MEDTISGAIAVLREAFPAEVRHRPLDREELRVWERRHGVVLPEPYRTFVTEIANGTDDGPPDEGGLLPLGEKPDSWAVWEADCWMSPEPFDGAAVRVPGQPFPLEEEWQWEYDYYDHTRHSSLLHQTYQHGSVLLGSDRPGEYWTLVVTGPQRGRVWWLRDGCAAPYVDRPSDQPGGDFLHWVRDWHVGQGWWRAE